jgi:hypothetical protein
MLRKPKLYMVILGATPKGRLTEQHDVFFGIAHSLAELVPQMKAFWPEAQGKIHIDSWREVTFIDGYEINVVEKQDRSDDLQLYFINLGGYKENELEEHHYKVLAVADTMAAAVKQSKTTSFYKHCGFKGAESHIDDKFGIDVDDIYIVNDILNDETKKQYALQIRASKNGREDPLHIGYLKIEKIQNSISV